VSISPRQAISFIKEIGITYKVDRCGYLLPSLRHHHDTDHHDDGATTATNTTSSSKSLTNHDSMELFVKDTDLFLHLSQYGFPSSIVDWNNTTKDDRLSLKVYIACQTVYDLLYVGINNILSFLYF
jgi:hypothetical protein